MGPGVGLWGTPSEGPGPVRVVKFLLTLWWALRTGRGFLFLAPGQQLVQVLSVVLLTGDTRELGYNVVTHQHLLTFL